MSFDPQSPSDRLDLEPDDFDPAIDWNADLYVHKTPPTDKPFWAVGHEGEVWNLTYWDEATVMLGRATYSTDEGEGVDGSEIAGWTFDREEAERAGELLASIDDALAAQSMGRLP